MEKRFEDLKVVVEQSLASNSSASATSVAAVKSATDDLNDSMNSVYDEVTNLETAISSINNNITNNILPATKKNIYCSSIKTAPAGGGYNLSNSTVYKLETGLAFFQTNRVRFGGVNGSADATITSYNSTSGDTMFAFDSFGTLPAAGCYVTILPASFNLSKYAIATTYRAINQNDSIIAAISLLERGLNINSTITPASIKATVFDSSRSWQNGELQGAQPTGSIYGMRFTDNVYRYEYMTSAADTSGASFVWIRTQKV